MGSNNTTQKAVSPTRVWRKNNEVQRRTVPRG